MPDRQWEATRVVASFLRICGWIFGALGLLGAIPFFILAFAGVLTATDQTLGAFGLAAGIYFMVLGFGALLCGAVALLLLLAAAERLMLLVAIEENTRISAYAPRPTFDRSGAQSVPLVPMPQQYPLPQPRPGTPS
jgi:hypothetical protein